MGKIVGLYISPDAESPMISVDQARALPGLGLEGDRYARGLGLSVAWVPDAKCDVTFISLEALKVGERLSASICEAAFVAADTRRNIVTEGVALNELVGKTFVIGGVQFLGSALANPCSLISERAGKIGFKQLFAGRGGLRAAILTEGIIAVGYTLEVL